jgi:hypothetical protein
VSEYGKAFERPRLGYTAPETVQKAVEGEENHMAQANSGSRSGSSRTKSASSGTKAARSRSSGGRTRSNRSPRSSPSNGRASSSAKRSNQSRASSPSKRSSKAKNSKKTERANKNLPDYSIIDPQEIDDAVDVYVDAPVVNVDEIKFELDDLRVHLAVLAEAGHFVQINAGAAARLGKVELDIQGVKTQALLEARLHNVTAILARVLTTLDRNPELLKSVGDALGDVGGGAHDLLTDTGDLIRSAGKGAGSAVQDVGRGAGKGVAGLGRGAQQGVEGLGQGAQQGVQGVGQGAQQGLESLGQGGQQDGTPQNGG